MRLKHWLIAEAIIYKVITLFNTLITIHLMQLITTLTIVLMRKDPDITTANKFFDMLTDFCKVFFLIEFNCLSVVYSNDL